MKPGSISSSYQFHHRQIVCLEHETTRLYAEVIEFVELRQVCWLRPVMLTRTVTNNPPVLTASSDSVILSDLRHGPDLLVPTRFVRLALDTEVIPLLTQLQDHSSDPMPNPQAHYQLTYFISQIWQTHPKELESEG